MAVRFLRDIVDVWKRQKVNWRTVVTRQVFNRFFNEMTLQYNDIYIRELGATAVQLGAVNSASGLGTTLITKILTVLRYFFTAIVYLMAILTDLLYIIMS